LKKQLELRLNWQKIEARNEMPRDPIISPSATSDQKVVGREVIVQESSPGNAVLLPGTHLDNTISASKGDYGLESANTRGLYEPADVSSLPVTQVDLTKLIGALRQLEVMARRQPPRIAFKANGKIFSWI
jgi:hypothetical protein